jgi:hypothetical protein
MASFPAQTPSTPPPQPLSLSALMPTVAASLSALVPTLAATPGGLAVSGGPSAALVPGAYPGIHMNVAHHVVLPVKAVSGGPSE